jgi:hypothetical protein
MKRDPIYFGSYRQKRLCVLSHHETAPSKSAKNKSSIMNGIIPTMQQPKTIAIYASHVSHYANQSLPQPPSHSKFSNLKFTQPHAKINGLQRTIPVRQPCELYSTTLPQFFNVQPTFSDITTFSQFECFHFRPFVPLFHCIDSWNSIPHASILFYDRHDFISLLLVVNFRHVDRFYQRARSTRRK